MFTSIISSACSFSFSSTSSSAFLVEEGIVWSKGGEFDLLDMEEECGVSEVKALIEASKGYEFTPRRYNGAAALFVSVGVITLDWDLDETMHAEGCIVEGVDSLEDIVALLEQDIEFHPEHVWELQATRSGYHAVLLSDCMVPPNIRDEWMLALGCDPLYVAGRKGGLYDWRVTPKHEGDPICVSMGYLGDEGFINPSVEDLLDLYYAAIKAVKEGLMEDPDLLYLEETPVGDEAIIAEVDNYLRNEGYSDWYQPDEVFNPLTGENVYVIRAYTEDNPDWWSRVTIKL